MLASGRRRDLHSCLMNVSLIISSPYSSAPAAIISGWSAAPRGWTYTCHSNAASLFLRHSGGPHRWNTELKHWTISVWRLSGEGKTEQEVGGSWCGWDSLIEAMCQSKLIAVVHHGGGVNLVRVVNELAITTTTTKNMKSCVWYRICTKRLVGNKQRIGVKVYYINFYSLIHYSCDDVAVKRNMYLASRHCWRPLWNVTKHCPLVFLPPLTTPAGLHWWFMTLD